MPHDANRALMRVVEGWERQQRPQRVAEIVGGEVSRRCPPDDTKAMPIAVPVKGDAMSAYRT
jgi:hypothetical protein